MPNEEKTVTVTFTDVDGHSGDVKGMVCEDLDDEDTCETPFSLAKESGDESTGAVYKATFMTALKGTLSLSINASDNYDFALLNRTNTFTIDSETPWLVQTSVNSTSVGENDDVGFSAIYCVGETQSNPCLLYTSPRPRDS